MEAPFLCEKVHRYILLIAELMSEKYLQAFKIFYLLNLPAVICFRLRK